MITLYQGCSKCRTETNWTITKDELICKCCGTKQKKN